MGVGYEGAAYLAGEPILCTGASVPRSRQIIESSSGYGGRIDLPVAEIGIGSPHAYDWSEYSGSLDFEVHNQLISNQLKPWLFHRQNSKRIYLYPRLGSYQNFEECYWTSLDLGTAPNSQVTGSVGFFAMDRDDYELEDDYIGDVRGREDWDFHTKEIIPFWKTTVSFTGAASSYQIIDWKLSFSQDIQKIFLCKYNTDPIAPTYIGIGLMTATLDVTVAVLNTTVTILDTLPSAVVTIDTNTLNLAELELTTATDAIEGNDSMEPISLNYNIYQLVS